MDRNKKIGYQMKMCISALIIHYSSLIILLLLLTGFSFSSRAQQYPVQGSLIMLSPYPSHLGDYANPAMEKLSLTLTCTDINLANLRVRMKVSIYKGSSLLTQSTDAVINEPAVLLDGGIPVRLTSAELAVYFKLENLQGITPEAWSQTLPEGVYTFTFHVFDYYTGALLSQNINQQFWLMLNDPPLLNAPLNKENIQQSTGISPQIPFQWTPRTTQVSNTEYEFTLVELWDDYGDPYQQFLAGVPKFKTTTSQTTFLYGITEPPLIPGRLYGWRVRAMARQGLEDIGLYRNDGYSNIYTFKYAGQCDAIQSVNGEVKGSDRIYLEWQQPQQAMSLAGAGLYKVAYRKYSSSNKWEWVEMETLNGYINLSNLDADTEYEIKAGNVCDNSLVGYSIPIRLRTKVSGTDLAVNCGQAPTLDLSNKTLLEKLSVYDVVTATDFPITITRAEGNANGWSGEGWVRIPYMADTKVHVLYKGIKVNTDYKLIDGYFETAYDPNGGEIYSIDEAIETVKGLVSGIKDLVTMTVDKDAKDIAKLTQAIKEQAAQEMPPALQEKMDKALTAVNEAKKEYDEAKKEYDRAKTPQEQEIAKKKLDAAGDKFSKAMDDVKAVQKEQDELVKGVTDVIVKAIKELKEEYESKQPDAKKSFDSRKKLLQEEVYSEQQIKEGSEVSSDIVEKDGWDETVAESSLSNELKDFAAKAKEFNSSRMLLASIQYVLAMERHYSDSKAVEGKLKDDNLLEGKTLMKQVMEKQQQKETDEKMIVFVKQYLEEKIKKL